MFRIKTVLGEKGHQIRQLIAEVQKRFGFPEGSVVVGDKTNPERIHPDAVCAATSSFG